MSKQIKFVFEREDGQTLETNAINIVDEVIDHFNSTSTTAALSANKGRDLYNSIFNLRNDVMDLEYRVPQLIWSGYKTLYNYEGIYMEEALMYPDLFNDNGLFALTFQTIPSTPYDGGPFVTTVFIDTEVSGGGGSASFSGMCFGSVNYGDMSGVLLWGDITFDNASGYVEFRNGRFYDFGEINISQTLTPGILDSIELLSIHRISRET